MYSMKDEVMHAEASIGSDEALCELLGLESLEAFSEEVDSNDDAPSWPCHCRTLEDLSQVQEEVISSLLNDTARQTFAETSVCIFPPELSVPSSTMQRLTEQVVRGQEVRQADRTMETIKIRKSDGSIHDRSVLTRLENLNSHPGWAELCQGYIRRCISVLMGQEMVLFKTKLNLKPAGGSGFAPHIDAPSLQIAFGEYGPQTFVTVMIAIDDMTVTNGCLSMATTGGSGRPWTDSNTCPTIAPMDGASPDAGGRAGAIASAVADALDWKDVLCTSGQVVAFTGWVPHRSASNHSHFCRRAVFLTYNPASEGEFYETYYERMAQLRLQWKTLQLLQQQRTVGQNGSASTMDQPVELCALATIPRN
jgi:ectoine hydroxylase-related dioxygenase (phytanoyl-CoA dioxygenase family)